MLEPSDRHRALCRRPRDIRILKMGSLAAEIGGRQINQDPQADVQAGHEPAASQGLLYYRMHCDSTHSRNTKPTTRSHTCTSSGLSGDCFCTISRSTKSAGLSADASGNPADRISSARRGRHWISLAALAAEAVNSTCNGISASRSGPLVGGALVSTGGTSSEWMAVTLHWRAVLSRPSVNESAAQSNIGCFTSAVCSGKLAKTAGATAACCCLARLLISSNCRLRSFS